jgi:hypothetical protein
VTVVHIQPSTTHYTKLVAIEEDSSGNGGDAPASLIAVVVQQRSVGCCERCRCQGGEIAPMACEDGGRLTEGTVAYMNAWDHDLVPGWLSEAVQHA